MLSRGLKVILGVAPAAKGDEHGLANGTGEAKDEGGDDTGEGGGDYHADGHFQAGGAEGVGGVAEGAWDG